MKKQYSTEDLAKIARQTLNLQYDSPQKILDGLKASIKGKVKSLHIKELTENEIDTNSLKFATDIFNDLDRLSLEFISANFQMN